MKRMRNLKKEDGLSGILYALYFVAIIMAVSMFAVFKFDSDMYIFEEVIENGLHVAESASLATAENDVRPYVHNVSDVNINLSRAHILPYTLTLTKENYNSNSTKRTTQEINCIRDWATKFQQTFYEQINVNSGNVEDPFLSRIVGNGGRIDIETVTIFEPIYEVAVQRIADHEHTWNGNIENEDSVFDYPNGCFCRPYEIEQPCEIIILNETTSHTVPPGGTCSVCGNPLNIVVKTVEYSHTNCGKGDFQITYSSCNSCNNSYTPTAEAAYASKAAHNFAYKYVLSCTESVEVKDFVPTYSIVGWRKYILHFQNGAYRDYEVFSYPDNSYGDMRLVNGTSPEGATVEATVATSFSGINNIFADVSTSVPQINDTSVNMSGVTGKMFSEHPRSEEYRIRITQSADIVIAETDSRKK